MTHGPLISRSAVLNMHNGAAGPFPSHCDAPCYESEAAHFTFYWLSSVPYSE